MTIKCKCDNKVQYLPSAAQAMVHINKLRHIFKGQFNVENCIFISVIRVESCTKIQRFHPKKQSKVFDFYFLN